MALKVGASPALHQRSGLATAGKQTVSHECDAFSSADLAEPVPLVKLHADDVLREDAGLDRPNPLTFSRLDERSQERSADTTPSARFSFLDPEFPRETRACQ
jgi:hypothetical protein